MMIIAMNIFKRWKPKGKMYSLRCFQCGFAFLSSFNLDAPICGKCIQKAKSLDSTIDNEKICTKCGNRGNSEFVIFFVASVRSYNISILVFLAGIRRSRGRCCKTQDRGNRERKSRYLKEGDKVYEDGYRHRYVLFLVYHVGDNNNSGY